MDGRRRYINGKDRWKEWRENGNDNQEGEWLIKGSGGLRIPHSGKEKRNLDERRDSK